MSSSTIAGVGTRFQRWNSFGSVWETIAEVNAIVGPNRAKENIDVTSFNTLDGYREFSSGFKVGGEVSLAMSFSRDNYEKLKQDFESHVPGYYAILLVDISETSLYFTGFVAKLPITAEADDKVNANITIQVTGEISMDEYSDLPSDEEPSYIEPSESEDAEVLFLSDIFDFDNKKWLDQSGYDNHADLVGGYCLEILQDTTLTPVTSLSGLSVSQVNRAGITTGVSISGANLIFDYSEMPDKFIESVTLSDGQEFKFTTGFSIYAFSAINRGSLSGTEDTTWRWSTKDGLLLNLREGCSIYPSVINVLYRRGLNVYSINVVGTNKRAWEAHWEGYPITTATAFKVPVMTLNVVSTYANLLLVDRSAKAVYFGCRDSFWISKYYDGEELDGWLKFRVIYNGCGATNPDNYQIYFQDELIELVEESSGAYPNEDYTIGMSYFGSGSSDADLTRTAILKNVYYWISGAYIYLIKDGLVFSDLIYDEPSGYVTIPVFEESSSSSLDALGGSPLNQSYSNAHNGCEVKVKMHESAALIAADTYEILFTSGSANSLNIPQLYSNYNDKIYIDNHIHKIYFNLLVTNIASDYNDFVNGLGDVPLRYHVRCDTSGAADYEADLFGEFVAELNSLGRELHAQAHTGWDPSLDSDWLEQIAAGNLGFAIHYFIPAFYLFANYSEGYLAYVNASQEERDSYAVTENMGTIGAYYTSINSRPLTGIELLHNSYGIPYPDGVTPSETDDNEMWWDWVFQAFQTALMNTGADNGFSSGDPWHFMDTSTLGNYPNGTYSYQNHPDLLPIMNTNLFGVVKAWDKDGYVYTDNLANGESVFGAQLNAFIVADSSEDSSEGWEAVEQLLGYNDTAYGSFDLGEEKDYMESPWLVISFKVRCLRTTGNLPIGLIRYGNYGDEINFGAATIEINEITTANMTNPCQVGVWYEIVFARYGQGNGYLRIYEVDSEDQRGECLAFGKKATFYNNALGEFLIENTGVDSEFRDVSIKATWDSNWYEYAREMIYHFPFDGADWEIGVTAEEHATNIKKWSLRNAMRGKTIKLYSHYFRDEASPAEDGTWQGIIDRSYNILKSVATWYQDNGWITQNAEELKVAPLDVARVNFIKNGNLSDSIGGITGEVWGLTGGVATGTSIVVDSTETANNSIDGTNVAKIPQGYYMLYDFVPPVEGLYFFQFWAKGEFYVSFNSGLYASYRSYQGNISATDWTFFKLPFYPQAFGPQRVYIKLHSRSGDTYIHKLAVWKDGASRTPDAPSDLIVTWVEDYADINFVDNSDGIAEHEIWRSWSNWHDSEEMTLVTTLASGVTSYHDTTWQNANLVYKVRAKVGSTYSDYSDTDSLTSPWVFKMDQSTLEQVYIYNIFNYTSGHLTVIHWGDGTTTNVTVATGANTVTHDYTTVGQYFVWLDGDVDCLSRLEWYNQITQLHDTDISKWLWPSHFNFGHFYSNGFIGGPVQDLYNRMPGGSTGVLGNHFGNNYMTGDITTIVWPSDYWDLHLSTYVTNGYIGDISDWVLPVKIAHFQITGYVSGDMTNVLPWQNTTYGSLLINLISNHPTGFYGDWSGLVIPDRTPNMTLQCYSGCHFTNIPRGAFYRVAIYNFRNNSVSGELIDEVISLIEENVTDNAPLQNCSYYFDGATMGTVSSESLTLIDNIKAKYTAAGFTATFYVNS